MNKTPIEYLTHTWSPIAMKCTPVSVGCQHCWHLRMAKRLAANPSLPEAKRKAWAGGKPYLDERELEAPLRLRKPSVIGVQFMGDLFHEDVPWEAQHRILNVMAKAYQHRFLLLTKRPGRMRGILQRWESRRYLDAVTASTEFRLPANFWLGTSAEDQLTADERIPELLRIPAAGHFVSLEPLLSAVNLSKWLTCCCAEFWPGQGHHPECPTQRINGIIVGGETGPGARPMHPDWVRGVRDQCQEAGVPFHFKSWGAWVPMDQHPDPRIAGNAALGPKRRGWIDVRGEFSEPRYSAMLHDACHMWRVGKKRAGRLLDGRTWDEVPEMLR